MKLNERNLQALTSEQYILLGQEQYKQESIMQAITVEHLMSGTLIREGAGVKLMRYIGVTRGNDFDPILLFDYFDSHDPLDYIAGFPAHPHKGFETITYMLQGRMQHKDNQGHQGIIDAGDVQWMTAGRGIVHSEMPAQNEGHLAGVQLWLNLPAADKLCVPAYQEFVANQLPIEALASGVIVKVIAGETENATSPLSGVATQPLFFDIQIPAQVPYHLSLPVSHRAIVFVLSGALQIGNQTVNAKQLAILSVGDDLTLQAKENDSACLLIAAKTLNEPIARLGPFVMNTQAEIQEALDDFRNNRF